MDPVIWGYVGLVLGLAIIAIVLLMIMIGLLFGICQVVIRLTYKRGDGEKELDFGNDREDRNKGRRRNGGSSERKNW